MIGLKDLVILGAGGCARETAWLVEEINKSKKQWNLLGFIDENIENHVKMLNGYAVLGGFSWLDDKKDVYCVCAVGNPISKKKLCQKAVNKGAKLATLVHPEANISKYVDIGQGTIICVGSIITTNIKVGQNVLVSAGCTIGHDAVIGDYVTLLPRSTVSGTVNIGEGCSIGAGATIINNIDVGEWTIVGAGAVVADHLPSFCTAVGVPAKVIKRHEKI